MDLCVEPSKLHQELASAGLPVVSVHSDGRVDYSHRLTKSEESKAQEIIANHDPAPD